MKILYITTDSHIAGTEKNLLNLMIYIKGLNNDVELLTLMGNNELIKKAKSYGLKATNLNMKKFSLKKYGELKRILRDGNYDMIHSFLFHANILSRLFKPKGVPLINSFRSEDKWKKPFHLCLERITKNKVDTFTINFSNNNTFCKRHGIKKIYYIPNGIKEKDVNLAQHNPFTIGLIGRFHSVKRHILLIKSFLKNSCIQKYPINFKFIGRGKLKGKIQSFIDMNNLSDRFEIYDFIDDEKKIYNNLSVVICVSQYEGFPNTLLEASSYGIPVISFKVGGTIDIIENSINGFLVNDFDELFKKLIKLYENKTLYEKLSENSPGIIDQRFSLEYINSLYLNLYRERSKKEIKK